MIRRRAWFCGSGNARTSANPGVGRPSGLRVATHTPPEFSTAPDGHLRDQVAAHIEGGATRLTEAWVSIMRCETKADREGCTAGRRRAAPNTRPVRKPASTFLLVSAIPGNGLS